MKLNIAVRWLVIPAALSSITIAAMAQPAVVAGEYLVKFKTARINGTMMSQKISGHGKLKASYKSLNMYHIALNASEEQQSLNDLRNDPDVAYVEPNYILSKSAGDAAPGGKAVKAFSRSEVEQMGGDVSAQSGTYSQSGSATRTAASWGVATPYNGTNDVVVAVVDTGLDSSHKVFQAFNNYGTGGANTGGTGAVWVNTVELNGVAGVDDDSNGYVDDIHGWNFITNTNNFYDDDDHGTHVSGIIVGTGLDISATTLAHSKILIMPLKFLDSSGSGATSNAIRAIYYAVDNGARVINNSWGGSSYSTALHEAMTYAYNHEVSIVTAAGNYAQNNDSTPMYPANYDVPSNISVAATTDADGLAYFSNYGATLVHIGSPGMNIYSTIPGNYYGYMSGTSMAAPFISGTVAMALSEAPNLTGYQVKNLILAQVDNDPSLSGKTTSSGRVDSYNTVQGAQGMIHAQSYQPSYSPDYSALDMASSSDTGKSGGGCGLVSTTIAKEGPGAFGGPLGILAGLMLLPVMVWLGLRRKAEAGSPQSRRRYERFRMSSEVRVKVGDRELIGAINTISQGGLSFNVDEALEKGGIVTMKIASPDGHESIEVQGQIVWSEQNQAYGVQFANAHEGVRGMIQHWTQSLVKG